MIPKYIRCRDLENFIITCFLTNVYIVLAYQGFVQISISKVKDLLFYSNLDQEVNQSLS